MNTPTYSYGSNNAASRARAFGYKNPTEPRKSRIISTIMRLATGEITTTDILVTSGLTGAMLGIAAVVSIATHY